MSSKSKIFFCKCFFSQSIPTTWYLTFSILHVLLQRARIPRGIQLVIEKSLGLVDVTDKKRIKSDSGKNKKDKESKKRRQSKEKEDTEQEQGQEQQQQEQEQQENEPTTESLNQQQQE